ncbi:MAG: recombinase family protein [Cellulosilyticaceae bacterium]
MKAALYIRVSTHFQIDKDSLPMQRQDLINYSKYAINADSYEIFEDAGFSAKNTDRPAYQDMMTRIRNKEFTHLIVWKIDRISRNLLDFSKMYDELKKYNVTFVSKNEQFDTSSAMGEAMLKIILVFAELERKLTSERVHATMLSRAEKGLWNGATVPLGYNWSPEKKFPVVNEYEANTVRRIYDEYLKIKSTTKVATILNESNVLTKRGGTWRAKTINDILRNPFYIGTYRYNIKDRNRRFKKEDEWIVVENNHEPIVDKPIFDKVQLILEKNYRGDNSTQRENIHTHIFSGLIYCGKCGTRFWSGLDVPRSDGYRPSRYVCYNNQHSCSNFISDVTLMPFIVNYIGNYIRLTKKINVNYSFKTIEKELLRGKYFCDVLGLDQKSLESTYMLFAHGYTNSTLEHGSAESVPQNIISETDTLQKEKSKYEKAISRLESLYLFSEDSMSEKDFIFKKRDLMKQLEQVNVRLRELAKPEINAVEDTDWLTDSEYFLLTYKLQETLFVDYRDLLELVSPELIQKFIKSIITEIHVADKKILSITFSNGITHHFAYKEKIKHSTREHLLYKKFEDDLLQLLKEKPEITRSDVENLTGMKRASCNKLIAEFIERDIIEKVGHSVSTKYIYKNVKNQ